MLGKASLTQWRWVWAHSGRWWWTGKPGVLRHGVAKSRHDLGTEQQCAQSKRWTWGDKQELPSGHRGINNCKHQCSEAGKSGNRERTKPVSWHVSLVLGCSLLWWLCELGLTFDLAWGPSAKDSACNAGAAGAAGSIPGLGRSPGEGNGNLLQCSCLENPMDRGAWWATVHGVAKIQTWLKWWSSAHVWL